MKKTISIVLAALLTLGLVGCGSKSSTSANDVQSSKVVEESKDLNKDKEENKESNKTEEESKETKETPTKQSETNNTSKEVSKSTNTSSQSILTKDFKEVSSLEITYNKVSKTYTVEKDKDFIKKVYDSIASTKTTVKNDRDESDSKFTIKIVYKSGNKDVIQSTETGQFIYRVFDNKTGRVCGTNTTLINLVK